MSFGPFDDFQEFKKIVWAILIIVFFIFLKYHLLVQLRVTISQTLGLLQISREEYNHQRTVQTQEQIETLKKTQHYKLIQNMRGNSYENQNWQTRERAALSRSSQQSIVDSDGEYLSGNHVPEASMLADEQNDLQQSAMENELLEMDSQL